MKTILMSEKETKKLEAVQSVRSGRDTQKEAAGRLGVTDRSVRNWLAAFDADRAEGLIHGNRGQESPRKLKKRERDRIARLVRTKYADFGPTLAAEKLAEGHRISRDAKTVRAVMVDEGLWVPRAKRKGACAVHRAWRERRARRGELVQFDGSYHPWLEGRLLGADGRPAELCLLAAIDDATGEVLWARFAPHEGTLPVMAFWAEYARRHGLPSSLYLDRFSTYKMTQRTAQENHDLKTQLQRAMDTLGVGLVFALSPQAKGRVERLFKTLQDRLVKEMRLRGIDTAVAADRFLEKTFLPAFNRKYRVEPRDRADAHRRLSARETVALPETLCRMERRTVMNDFTVSFRGQWHQVLPTKGLAIRPKDEVAVREYPDGTLSFSIRGKRAETKPIAKRSEMRPATPTTLAPA